MLFALFAVILFYLPLWSGTTGKIAGTVIDKSTGDPLPGANVLVMGTVLGAAADISGNYTILYVPPGVYTMKVSVIGYTEVVVTDVRVRIDQTARVDVDLEMEAIEGEIVTIVAEKNIIKKDVATSVVAVTNQEIEELPVSNVANVVGLQAGIQNGLEIRGGGSDEALVLMDGVMLRDPRNNQPVSGIALSAIKEISIERGGFNAEYGQVRSGIVNVVTREGSKKNYHGSVELKYSPPHAKYFGISPFDKNSFWLKPYFDDDVCWTGTDNGAWDVYTQRQYFGFEGWNAVSERLMTDNDPTNNLSPQGAQRVLMWETRKEPAYNQPDYNIDAGFGGPVPFVYKALGNLRFFTSFRRYREMLVVPLSRDDYVEYDWTLKLTSDISPSKKLLISAVTGKQYTMQQNWSYNYLRTPETIASLMEDRAGTLFGTGVFSLTDIGHKSISAKFTNMLNKETYYEVSLEHFIRDYYSRPPAHRDITLYEILPGYFTDEAPLGYSNANLSGITGMIFGGHNCKRRDNTRASATTFKADLTSQINFSNLVKTGFESVYNDIDFDYGIISSFTENIYDERIQLKVNPIRSAFYLQDKLETKGFIMNAGLRLDYSNSNTDWWNVDPYDQSFFSSRYSSDTSFEMTESKSQWQLSPRLGISHPITENSKLFFNYGHFKQMPSYQTLFQVARATNGSLSGLGDPNLILAKTISYELGYDHTFLNHFLLQVAAFYHDIFDQQNTTLYTSVDGLAYNKTTSNSYEDIRGFELTLRKNRGYWWTFFGNYTYQVSTSGHFGSAEMYEDPSEQKKYDEDTVNLYQERPTPSPYARANLSFYTPDDFGPEWLGIYPLGGYLLNLLVDWRAGGWRTWAPLNPSVQNNIQETDHFNAILRFGKTFHFNKFKIQVFVDIDNVFNYRRMSLTNFRGEGGDYDLYVASLHFPESNAYNCIPGNDRFGDYRKDGVEYQPMFPRGSINFNTDDGDPGVIYYDLKNSRYVEYVEIAPGEYDWMDVDSRRLYRILKDKAYIDMPNYSSFSFFNPRQIYLGLRISMDLN